MPPMWDLRDDDDDDDDDDGGTKRRGDGGDSGDGGGDSGGDSGGDNGGDSGGGDQGGDSGGDQSGGDQGGGDQGGGGFDWGDSGGDQGGSSDQGGGDSGWSAVQDYQENGRTIRKFTDASGTDYFQDIGSWGSQDSSPERGFDWGDGSTQQDNGSQAYTPPPDVHPDIQDLHDYYHPYTISKFENDPVRQGWVEGTASDGTRFDQQDPSTQDMFTGAYGDQAASSWAEQRSRDLQNQFQTSGVVTLPKPQAPETPSLFPGAGTPAVSTGDVGISPDGTTAVAPDGRTAPVDVNRPMPPPPDSETAIPPYVPPAADAPTPAPPDEAPSPQAQAPAAPSVAVHPAVQAAADATARAGGSPQQVAQAAIEATRNLTSESPETQQQFQQAYGADANTKWQAQHREELQRNYALYGASEPRAGTAPVAGAPPGIGPAPDRTIGRAQPAPWNQPTAASPAAPPSANALGVGAVGPLPAPRTINPPVAAPPSAIYHPPTAGEPGGPPLAPGPVLGDPPPTAGEPGGPPLAPGPVLGQPYVTPQDIETAEGNGPATVGPGGESASDILTIKNGLGEVRQEPRWAWDQRGPQGQQVWEVVNAEGHPTQTMREAGFSPASNQIDTSIRQTAGVPAAPPTESPNDQIVLVDDAQGTTRVVPRSQLPDWMRPVAPGVPAPWRIADVRPAAGAAPPPPPAAPAAPPSPSIDTSVRAVAGVPVPENLDQGIAEGDHSAALTTDPFGHIVGWAARLQGATDVVGFARNVAAGVAAREAWAEPYANDMARLAWYRESRGLEGDPTQAPGSYIEDWKGAFRAGDTSVPLVREISQQLAANGVAPPQVQASTVASAPTVQTNLSKWTLPGSSMAGTNLVPDQFKDPAFTGLKGWDPYATCGVTAGVGVARALGIDVSPAEAFALATRSGYTSEGGMNGTANMATYLDRLGVPVLGIDGPTHGVATADPARIDAELAAGRPVVIDTAGNPGHYFTISSRTSDGAYVVSGSGTALAHGASIMTRQQMEASMGSWRNAVFLDPSKLPQEGERQAPSGSTVRLQSTENAPQALVAPEAQPAEENLFQATPERWTRMEAVEALPMADRQQIFEDAMDQGLAAEGVTGADADYWKNNMRMVVTGQGLVGNKGGENADLNPYMLTGESGGVRKTARASSALGYFQFLRQNPDGSPYGHVQYAPDEYKDKPYDPVGQVRQFVRAIKASKKYNGDPGGVVRDKNRTGTWGP